MPRREFDETRLTRGLILAARQWRRLAAEVGKAHGISEATLHPFITLGRMDGPARQNVLAEASGIEGPSLVRLIDQLEEAGFVRREEDTSDRRAKRLSLTETGRARIGQIETDLARIRAETFAGLPASDLEAAERIFAAVGRAAGASP